MPFKPHPTDPDKMIYVKREYILRKEWQELTDEEMMELYVKLKSVAGFYSLEKYGRSIEAKLKEKNG